jgi:ABC-2 type transport system permease protein
MNGWRTCRLVAEHEGRVLLADRTLWLVSVLFLALVSYGLYNGAAQAAVKERALATALEAQQRGEQSRRDLLTRILAGQAIPDPFANPADPASMGGGYGARYAYMPISPLAPLAFGQSDLLADYYRVTQSSKVTFIYDTEIENPWNLMSGHFDLSFVVVYLLPLLIFALTYNFLSAEREHGTLRMLLSQPIGLPALVGGKILVRAGVLLGWAVLVPIASMTILRPEARSSDQLWSLVAWGAFVTAYGALWFALAVAVNAFGRSSATNALILIGTWILTVLVIPVLLNLSVATASPAPSRTELATRTRLATIDALARHADLLATDYRYAEDPTLLIPRDGKIEIAARRKGMFLVERDVDQALDAVLASFQRQLEGQQRLVARYGALSPAIVAHEGLTALAGSGLRRHLYFQQQIDAFHKRWRAFFEPRMLNGLAIAVEDLDRIPTFAWQEEDPVVVRGGVAVGLAQLLVPTFGLLALGLWRLRRYSVV